MCYYNGSKSESTGRGRTVLLFVAFGLPRKLIEHVRDCTRGDVSIADVMNRGKSRNRRPQSERSGLCGRTTRIPTIEQEDDERAETDESIDPKVQRCGYREHHDGD